MGLKVCKFGGSSLADAGQFHKVRDILLSDPDRRVAVPSAPGKRNPDDRKITDLLYECSRLASSGQDISPAFSQVEERFLGIVSELSLRLDISPELSRAKAAIQTGDNPDYAASRGEYFSGLILANYLGWDFIDPAPFVRFDKQGVLSAEWTNDVLREELQKHDCSVMPGFYGSLPNGDIHTFSRGGSDISGAIAARAAGAELYENWTDVSGFLMADPRIVKNPRRIDRLTYRELRELSYMGATVLHEDAIFPVRMAGIPTNIRNTNDPAHPGTLILDKAEDCGGDGVITGIAGHQNFALISIEKAMMNSELGFGRRVLQALEESGAAFEHLPTGIDTMSVVAAESEIASHLDDILRRIEEACRPDILEVHRGVSLIATVGRGMVRNPGTAARLFTALARAHVNVQMIDQGSSELNIIVGVDGQDFEKAVRAIYEAFVEDGE